MVTIRSRSATRVIDDWSASSLPTASMAASTPLGDTDRTRSTSRHRRRPARHRALEDGAWHSRSPCRSPVPPTPPRVEPQKAHTTGRAMNEHVSLGHRGDRERMDGGRPCQEEPGGLLEGQRSGLGTTDDAAHDPRGVAPPMGRR